MQVKNSNSTNAKSALSVLQICALHHQVVSVKAPTIPEIDGKEMLCDGSRKTGDGRFVILNNEEYSYVLFVDGTIRLFA